MRILLLNQFFHPDPAATSQILTDAARDLARTSAVTAICGASAYANPDPGTPPPVTIRRTRNLGFRRSLAARLSSYITFLVGALWHGLRIPKPDAVLSLTTPPFLPTLASLLKTARGSAHYIWEMDLYPDIAIALGVLKPDGILARAARTLANWSRRRADGIIVLGEEMKERLVAQGIPAAKIHVCENWADGREITRLSFPEGPLAIHYSGNLGLAHDIATIREAMLTLRADSRFRFIFCGGGPQRDGLENLCAHHTIPHATFRPYCSRSELGRSLAEGHIGLVTQKPASLGSVVPSKTYGIMAAGRPILYIGPAQATPARIIQRFDCGWHIEPGDVSGLVSLLEYLDANRQLVYAAGRRARQAFLENYDRPIGVARVAAVLGVTSPASTETKPTAASAAV